jgi:cellulose synthase/poly-beta-1,6-N-acetylglucosamine synthase-like glycosyltransferase
MLLFTLILAIVLGYTGLCTLYLLTFALAGRLRPEPAVPGVTGRLRRVLVMLPAYREDAVIVDSAAAALRQTYPRDHLEVVVIADSLQPETLDQLRQLPIWVVPVSFDVSTKAKALQSALGHLPAAYDVAVVLDADNHMAVDCLFRLLAPFDRGFRAVQGHRVAKNLNTSVAILDAVSEEINNHLFRRGHRALGLSAALIGSGMAFDYALLRAVLPRVQVVSGFDKEMECVLLRDGVEIEYAPRALIYDEKVQSAAVFEKQRTRWLAAQLRILRENIGPGFAALLRGNVDYFDKAFQALLLPRLMLLGSLVVLAVLAAAVGGWWVAAVAGLQLALLLLTFYLSVPDTLRPLVGVKELLRLPPLFFRFVRSLFKVGRAKKQFIHTPHGTDEAKVA